MYFMVRFIGHIDARKRPENFPKEVVNDIFARVKNDKELRDAINNQAQVFINQQCMIVPKDNNKTEDRSKISFDNRMLVPLHMITHIDTITSHIVGEIPEFDENNVPKLMDGSDVPIQ